MSVAAGEVTALTLRPPSHSLGHHTEGAHTTPGRRVAAHHGAGEEVAAVVVDAQVGTIGDAARGSVVGVDLPA